jgi:trehalose 6-phosphate phosphatase
VKYLLGPDQRVVLRDLAGSRSLLAFDFDGTLAPIVARPGLARMRKATRSLLGEVARLYPCAVVTGRALADLRPRIAGLPLWAVVGNHGAENGTRRRGHREALRAVRSWLRILHERLAPIGGAWVEDKRYTLTIHYRGTSSAPRSRRAVLRVARSLPAARLVEGHYGVNVLPVAAPHKGIAVRALGGRARSESILYVGDDESDELVFSSNAGRGLVSVRVGRTRSSRAAYYLRDQREIDRLLDALIDLRAGAQDARGPSLSSAARRRR